MVKTNGILWLKKSMEKLELFDDLELFNKSDFEIIGKMVYEFDNIVKRIESRKKAIFKLKLNEITKNFLNFLYGPLNIIFTTQFFPLF